MDKPEAARPWERQPYDTPASWALFQVYLGQDPPRSLLDSYNDLRAKRGLKEAKKTPGSVRNVCAGLRSDGTPIPGALTFAQRAAAWDDYLAGLEREKWAKRRLKRREREFHISEQALDKAEQYLMFPVLEQAGEDGKTVIRAINERQLRTAVALLEVGTKIGRLASGLETERVTTMDWRDEARREGVDPDAEFARTVAGYREQLARANAGGGVGGGEAQPKPDGPGE